MNDKILIETYRGFEIYFDKSYEKFQCIITEENSKETASYKSIKKFIDDYKKDNQYFKPFWIHKTPNSGYIIGSDLLKVIGIRKDGRFIAENKNGEMEQISSYQTTNYMLVDNANENAINQLNELNALIQKQAEENLKKRNEIISTMKIVTLEEFKKSL